MRSRRRCARRASSARRPWPRQRRPCPWWGRPSASWRPRSRWRPRGRWRRRYPRPRRSSTPHSRRPRRGPRRAARAAPCGSPLAWPAPLPRPASDTCLARERWMPCRRLLPCPRPWKRQPARRTRRPRLSRSPSRSRRWPRGRPPRPPLPPRKSRPVFHVAPPTPGRTLATAAAAPSPEVVAATAPPAVVQAPPAEGTLQIIVSPWAEVEVDGARIGVSPPLKPLALAEGVHTVVLSHPEFQPFRRKVTISGGQTTRLQVDLAREAFPR
jgi:hypothetical protein